jgi:hypothetical protein
MSKPRLLSVALFAALAAALPSRAQDVLDLAGIYEVQGETVVAGSPDHFVYTGKLVLRQKGADLTTITEVAMRRTAGNSGPASAALIGSGEAKLDGRLITGSSELQTLVSQVAELDVAAPFAPRFAGPIVNAVASGVVRDDGSIDFEIKSTLTGEGFTLPEGRRTTLRAKRVAKSPTELKKK